MAEGNIMHIAAGSTDVSIAIYCRTTAGAALTGKVAADFSLTYRRAGANVAIALTDLAALTTAHADGGLKEVGNGEYRLDLPDAAVAAAANQVSVQGTVAGGVVLGYPIALTSDGTTGTGARVVTFTVTDAATLAGILGASIRLYRTGSLDRTGTTNAGGQATLYCDVDATWSYTVTHALYAGATGTVVVDDDESVAVALTTLSWPASTEPSSVTVRWKVKIGIGRTTAGENDATVYVRMKTPPTTDGLAWGNALDSDATDASGYVYFANVPVGCTLSARLGTAGQDVDVTIPSNATSPYDAGELIGDA